MYSLEMLTSLQFITQPVEALNYLPKAMIKSIMVLKNILKDYHQNGEKIDDAYSILSEWNLYLLKGDDVATFIIMKDPEALENIPKQYLTDELCMLAVSMEEEYLLTREKHSAVFKYLVELSKGIEVDPVDRVVFKHISDNVRPHYKKYKEYLQEYLREPGKIYEKETMNPDVLKDLYKKKKVIAHRTNFITQRLCDVAVQKKAINISLVPRRYINYEMCEHVVENDGSLISSIPEDLRSYELIKTAIEQDGKALEWIVNNVREQTPQTLYDICFKAVSQNGLALEFVPENICDENIFKTAVLNNPDAFAIRNHPDLQTLEICKFAVSRNPTKNMRLVDNRFKKPILNLFITSNPSIIKNQTFKSYIIDDIDLLKKIVTKDGLLLEHIPIRNRTPELCELAVRQNGYALKHVNLENKSKALCMTAVSRDYKALEFVPRKIIDGEICRIAVRKNSGALFLVPKNLRSKELCMLALSENGDVLQYVVKKDEDLCDKAISMSGSALEYVPDELRSFERCMKAVKNNGMALAFVPENVDRLYEIQMAAVIQNGNAIKFIYDNDIDLYFNAVNSDGNAVDYIKDYYKSEELFKVAVRSRGLSIQHIDDEDITQELCDLAVEQYLGDTREKNTDNVFIVKHIPRKFRNDELILKCVKINYKEIFNSYTETREFAHKACSINGLCLKHFNIRLKTADLCKTAVEQNGLALAEVPEPLKTEDMCEAAMKQNIYAVEYFPEELKRSKDMIMRAVKISGEALQYFKTEYLDESIAINAVKTSPKALKYINLELLKYFNESIEEDLLLQIALSKHGSALKYVDMSKRTFELCIIAIENDGMALQHVPLRDFSDDQKAILMRKAVNNNWNVIALKYPFNDVLYMNAFYQNINAFQFIPDRLKNADICAIAVSQNGLLLRFVPTHLKTMYICEIAFKQTPLALVGVPKLMRNYNMCFKAILRCRDLDIDNELILSKQIQTDKTRQELKDYRLNIMKWVPEKHRNISMCLAALFSNDTLRYIPRSVKIELKKQNKINYDIEE